MRAKAAEFRAAHAGRKLTISTIERLWGESRVISDYILKRLSTELTNTGGEQELIQEKKRLKRRWDNRPRQGEPGTADTNRLRGMSGQEKRAQGGRGRDSRREGTESGSDPFGWVFEDNGPPLQDGP
jgi:hypothetical protein